MENIGNYIGCVEQEVIFEEQKTGNLSIIYELFIKNEKPGILSYDNKKRKYQEEIL